MQNICFYVGTIKRFDGVLFHVFVLCFQLALDMWRKLMIEPLQPMLIGMLLKEIKK